MPDGGPRPVPAPAGVTRRRVLRTAGAGAVLLPVVLAGCSSASEQPADDVSDALLAMADAARMDAAVVATAVTADPGLAGRLEPLRAARMEHAAALDQAGGRPPGAAPVPAAPPVADVVAVRDSVDAAVRTAREVVPRASAQQVGLVAEVAACCAAYVAELR
ncbi:hypothetical protein AFB00_21135 [Pseudonocardia sp. HH130630-07]|nr:hypothetical protein AFB00_21135 [Pseudonocardia sp. HH130630-07]